MTPKEKAEQLVVKFLKHSRAEKYITPMQSAKQCALIAVNEIIDSLQIKNYAQADNYEYYNEVKQEIENL